MLTRKTRLQIIAFFVISAIAVVYALLRFTDVSKAFGSEAYMVRLRMQESGGIFTNAEVTYRGVQIGRVGEIRLTRSGMEVDLNIEPGSPSIPSDLDAVVANRSVVGEQFVDLRPKQESGPYLDASSVITQDRVRVPVSTDQVLRDLDSLTTSLPVDALRTVVDEMHTAFTGAGEGLQSLLDTTSSFTKAANEHLPQTIALLDGGGTVLDTQKQEGSSIKSFSRDLALIGAKLRDSDTDVRRLIAATPQAAEQVIGVLSETGPNLGVVVANLLTTSNIAVSRTDGIEQAFVTYPVVAVGATTVVGDGGTVHLGLAFNLFDPPPCVKGYEGTNLRPGSDVAPIAPNTKAYCAEPEGSPINVRGSQNAPYGGRVVDPTPAAIAAHRNRPNQQMAELAGTGGLPGLAGSQSTNGPVSMAELMGVSG